MPKVRVVAFRVVAFRKISINSARSTDKYIYIYIWYPNHLFAEFTGLCGELGLSWVYFVLLNVLGIVMAWLSVKGTLTMTHSRFQQKDLHLGAENQTADPCQSPHDRRCLSPSWISWIGSSPSFIGGFVLMLAMMASPAEWMAQKKFKLYIYH